MKTIQGLAVILIVVLAVFMVTSLNRVKGELVRLNQQIEALVTTTAQNSLGGYQAVSTDNQVQFRFVAVPTSTMLGMGQGSGAGRIGPGAQGGVPGGPGAAPAGDK
jgi:hypothetical protein